RRRPILGASALASWQDFSCVQECADQYAAYAPAATVCILPVPVRVGNGSHLCLRSLPCFSPPPQRCSPRQGSAASADLGHCVLYQPRCPQRPLSPMDGTPVRSCCHRDREYKCNIDWCPHASHSVALPRYSDVPHHAHRVHRGRPDAPASPPSCPLPQQSVL